jgi:hypothetical protein
MEFKEYNPYNGEQVGLYYALTQEELAEIKQNKDTFESWKEVSLSEQAINKSRTSATG